MAEKKSQCNTAMWSKSASVILPIQVLQVVQYSTCTAPRAPSVLEKTTIEKKKNDINRRRAPLHARGGEVSLQRLSARGVGGDRVGAFRPPHPAPLVASTLLPPPRPPSPDARASITRSAPLKKEATDTTARTHFRIVKNINLDDGERVRRSSGAGEEGVRRGAACPRRR